ncbi:reverse transcriptase domain-containing protein [Tanacetum coccineum]
MKELLRNCHGHSLTKGNIIKIFYHNLNEITQEALNTIVGGIFLYKIPNQAYQLLEDKVLLKRDWAKNQKPKAVVRKIVAFADEGISNSDTDKIMARMDAMTMKMDAQYKEMKSRTECNYCGEIFMDLKTKIETTTKNHQASIQNLEAKFDKLANKQSARPSGSLPSNTQPNPRGMPNYGKFLKELVSNKHKLDQIYSAFLSNESSAIIQNKVPPKLRDPRSFLIPCTFSKTFSCNALADLGASINLMPYSLYAKLSLKTLKPTKISVRLAERLFQYPIGIAENMLVEVGKFTFPVDFAILEMEEDSKVPIILGRPFLHTADAAIRIKQKQLNLGVGFERMIFSIDSAMKHSYLNDDTYFSIDVIDEILEEDFDALLDEDYKIKKSLDEPSTDLELKPLPDHLEYAFLEEPSLLPVIISSKLSEQNKNKLISVLKRYKQAFAWKTTNIPSDLDNSTNNVLIPLDSWTSGLLVYRLPLSGINVVLDCFRMDDPSMTMEEYIKFEEEKACRRGQVFNWQTATYGKIRVEDDLCNLSSVEHELSHYSR